MTGYKRITELQNELSKIVLVDFIPFEELRISKLRESIKGEFGEEISLKDDSSYDKDLTFLGSYTLSKETDLDGFNKVEIWIARQLGIGLTVLVVGEVDKGKLNQGLGTDLKSCRERKRRISDFEGKLEEYLQDISPGIVAELVEDKDSKIPSIWFYDSCKEENQNEPSNGEVTPPYLIGIKKIRKKAEFFSNMLSNLPPNFPSDTKPLDSSELRLLGRDPNSVTSTISGKEELIFAPGLKFYNTDLGNIRFRYLLFRIQKSDETMTIGDISSKSIIFEISRLFLPLCWSIWRYHGIQEPKVLPKETTNEKLDDLKRDYFNQLSRTSTFRRKCRKIKLEIDALEYLIDKKGNLPKENQDEVSLISGGIKLSSELLLKGKECLKHTKDLIRRSEKVNDKNLKFLDNIFSAKFSTSSLKLQRVGLALTVVGIWLAAFQLIEVFPRLKRTILPITLILGIISCLLVKKIS